MPAALPTTFVAAAPLLRQRPLLRPARCLHVTPVTAPSARSAAMRPPLLSLSQPPSNASPSTVPPLPAGSTGALAASATLSAIAVTLPAVLALSETSGSDVSFVSYLVTHYASHYMLLAGTVAFAMLHSGLASLRQVLVPSILPERFYRVLFALSSLPSAVALITFFVAHRYDGLQLIPSIAALQPLPQFRTAVYALTVVAFLFLYPATFNLLEVAAIQRPTFRFYEKGITRICRHPQLYGQLLWGISHFAWLGSSFAAETALALVAYHCFGVWNGDRRLRDKYTDDWALYAERTSILPFAAIVSGKQTLNIREFFVPAYAGVILAAVGFYAAHPAVYKAVAGLHW